ncbi:MAG: DUF389 domain-containing protein, partial [Gemmatimonadetes bacterium]|nr:DUF389 domain-containing protein [Gemmatimonadota bacterium]
MRQVMVRVPEGGGGRVLQMAAARGAVNVSRWQATGGGGERWDMVLAHLSNAAVGPFADELEALDDVHVSFLTSDALALRPPTDEIADQTRDVSLLAPLEIYLAGLQSIGSWAGFLGYAGIAGVVVWLGLATNSVFLLIGAMLIAPFASPAMNAALAAARGDGRLMRHAMARYGAALVTTAGVAAVLTLVFRQRVATEQMISVARVAPAAFLLPLAAGAAGALALAQSQRSSLVSGAGAGMLVAASLAPPAGVIGMTGAMGRWDLAVEAAFLLLLQFTGIGIAGTVAFRVLGVGPRGQRYPHGSRGGSRLAFGALAAGFAGLLAWQFASPPPTLVRGGLQEQAREVVQSALRGHPGVRLLETDAVFPRPAGGGAHPLLVRVYVQALAGSPDAPALERRLAAELEG